MNSLLSLRQCSPTHAGASVAVGSFAGDDGVLLVALCCSSPWLVGSFGSGGVLISSICCTYVGTRSCAMCHSAFRPLPSDSPPGTCISNAPVESITSIVFLNPSDSTSDCMPQQTETPQSSPEWHWTPQSLLTSEWDLVD